eukprot:CAMPEP_0171289438 /NCGR_PEP_ID=MMETSP0790-20130122/70603_1 /TAXON_ID=2925 /ORGANISM="Alexandrium catenella, Strain OF101" /LENGTH=114 /DNA_ID=CAMNT_0011759063 /DNA_START=77 /DNA_END=418 /DNA_ORIENTATION=+
MMISPKVVAPPSKAGQGPLLSGITPKPGGKMAPQQILGPRPGLQSPAPFMGQSPAKLGMTVVPPRTVGPPRPPSAVGAPKPPSAVGVFAAAQAGKLGGLGGQTMTPGKGGGPAG